jgi:signal transduction histidine kinase/ActR/RegA family two-component response regulator
MSSRSTDPSPQVRIHTFARRVRQTLLSTQLAVVTLAAAGILVTSLATAWFWEVEQTALIHNFGDDVDLAALDLEDDISRNLQLLNDLAIADQTVAGLEPGEFQAYVDQIMGAHPELLALSWVPRVPDSDRAAFEHEAESQTISGFRITEQDASGRLVPAATRAEYFPVYYAGTDGSNLGPWLGFDLASSPLRERALHDAEERDEPVATAPITLFQAGGKTPGFLAMRAVRNLRAPKSSTGRAPLRGYVQATFAIDQLIAETLAVHRTTVTRLNINDVTAPEGASTPLYVHAELPLGPIVHRSDISVAGRIWRLSASPAETADVQPRLESWAPVLVVGLLITLLAITLLTLGLTRSKLGAARTRAREEFVAMVSHDLRTPAMSLISGAEILLNKNLPESERQDVLATMLREGRRLNSLLNDFLEADDAGHGRLRVAPRPTDPRALLEYAVTAAGDDRERPVRLTLPRELPWVLADPDRIQQLVGNLLSNARKYSPVGGAIDLTAEVVDGMIQVSVSDQGLGIPAEALRRLFDPYYRVDSESRRDIRGTGLGLAIVKGIAEAHGGQVGVESAGSGRGSRFWFTLPSVEQPAAASSAPPSLGLAAPVNMSPTLAALRILVVDDDRAVGSMVRRLGRVDGHDVSVAMCAEEALEKLNHEAFDVVLSDLGLGTGLDGWQLAAAVRSRWPGIHVLLATGTAGIDPAAARTRGVDGVLTKPYSPAELRSALAQVASSKTTSRAA